MSSTNMTGQAPSETVTELLTLGMSDKVQYVLYGHDLTVDMDYDWIGRPVNISRAGNVRWQADSYDSAGRLTTESFGNGVQQVTERDVLGLPSRVQVNRSVMRARSTTWRCSTTPGLASSARPSSFIYDGAARLTDTTIGTGSEMYNSKPVREVLERNCKRLNRTAKRIGNWYNNVVCP